MTTMQYLNDVLSQSGPSALPYNESLKGLIRQQVCDLFKEFKGLTVRTRRYTHDYGLEVNLLLLDGTIPITFQNNTYNIPVNIFLPENFPKSPPIFYVTPTKEMVVKRGHSAVESSGLVNTELFYRWAVTQSTLLQLVKSASIRFSKEPPLFARPANHSVPVPPPTPKLSESSSQDSIFLAAKPSDPGPSSHTSSIFVREREAERAANEAARQKMVKELTGRMQSDLILHQRLVSQEIDKLSSQRGVLLDRRADIARGETQLKSEIERLEKELQDVRTNVEIAGEWLSRNDKQTEPVLPDSIFLPADALSRQALEEIAKDFALDDLMEALDLSIQEDMSGRRVLSPELYLKQIRGLAKEQFYHRALVMKIRAEQNRARVGQVAARGADVGQHGRV